MKLFSVASVAKVDQKQGSYKLNLHNGYASASNRDEAIGKCLGRTKEAFPDAEILLIDAMEILGHSSGDIHEM